MKDFDFDCLVIGGGIVGLTAVLELSRLGFSVLSFEKYRPKKCPFDLNTHIRNVSISHASHESLARLLFATCIFTLTQFEVVQAIV